MNKANVSNAKRRALALRYERRLMPQAERRAHMRDALRDGPKVRRFIDKMMSAGRWPPTPSPATAPRTADSRRA